MAEEPTNFSDFDPSGALSPETGEGMAPPAPVDYESAANIATLLSDEDQKAVAKLVVNGRDADFESSKDYREARARRLRLFLGILPDKPAGHENIAQIHLPLIARSVLLFHAKSFSQLFPSGGDIYGVKETEPGDERRAIRVARHMNWQVRKRIPEYVPAHDRGLLQCLLYGSAFSVWYYDPVKKRPCFEFCRTDDVVLPYKHLSDFSDLSDVPRITRTLHKYKHEIERLGAVGYYVNVDKMYGDKGGEYDPSLERSGTSPYDKGTKEGAVTEVVDQQQGTKKPENDPNAARELYEQHFWYQLPGEQYERPLMAVVDCATNTLLHLSLREREDPDDRARFNREAEANEAAFASQMTMFEQQQAAWEQTVSVLSQPRAEVDEMGMQVVIPPTLPEMLPPQPQQPPPPPQPDPVRKIPFSRFTHYVCIPNPEGIYGLGIGFLLEGDNVSADAFASAMISLMTMSLKPTFLYSRQTAMPRGEFRLNLGEGTEVPLPPEMVSKGAGIYQFQFPAPNMQGWKFLELFQQNAMELGAPEIFSGETSDRETATTTEIRASMAMQNLSTMAERYNRARTAEVKALAYINSQTLDPNEYFFVQHDDGELVREQVTPDDYIEDFDITFTADPNFASQPQRERAASRAMQALAQMPPGTFDPQTSVMLFRMLGAKLMRAIGSDDVADKMEAADPPPPPMMGPPGPEGPPQGETNGMGEMGGPGPGAQAPMDGEPGGAGVPTPLA